MIGDWIFYHYTFEFRNEWVLGVNPENVIKVGYLFSAKRSLQERVNIE